MNEFKINILVIEDGAGHINTVRDAFRDGYNEGLTFMEASIFPHEDNQEEYIGFIKKCSEDFHNGIANAENSLFEFILDQIKQNDIDAIFLDLLLSESEENIKDTLQPHLTSGGKILELLKSSVYRNMPVVAYTKLKNKLPKNEKVGSEIIFSVNKDGFNKDRFFQQQADFYRLYKEIENFKLQKKNLCDIAIICALKKELKPVIELFKEKDIEEKTDTSVAGYIVDKNGKKRKVVALTKEQMGLAEAATFTTQMIDKYSPSFVVMTGIAAGIDDIEQNFLDILMPAEIFNWQSGKFKEVKDGDKIIHLFDPDLKPATTYISKKTDLNIDTDYLKDLPEIFLHSEDFSGNFTENNIVAYIKSIDSKNGKYKSEFQKELLGLYNKEKEKFENKIEDIKKKKDSGEKKKELQELESKKNSLTQEDLITAFIKHFTQTLECRIQKDGMVSGSAVVADEELKNQEIKKRGIHGIDMEAYGVAYACNKHPSEPNVIILKSICDFADSTKNDIYQTAAAYVSAQAFYKLFTEVIDMD